MAKGTQSLDSFIQDLPQSEQTAIEARHRELAASLPRQVYVVTKRVPMYGRDIDEYIDCFVSFDAAKRAIEKVCPPHQLTLISTDDHVTEFWNGVKIRTVTVREE